jgi:hypothetical protein
VYKGSRWLYIRFQYFCSKIAVPICIGLQYVCYLVDFLSTFSCVVLLLSCSDQKLPVGLCFLPVCYCDPVFSYLLQCGMKLLPLLNLMQVVCFVKPLNATIKLAVKREPSPCCPSLLVHWVWDCYQYKLTAFFSKRPHKAGFHYPRITKQT